MSTLRLAALFLPLTLIPLSSLAQEEPTVHTGFSCTDSAVGIKFDRKPPLKFVAVSHLPAEVSYNDKHTFAFSNGPFKIVKIYLSATIPEEKIGRASAARLSVFAATFERDEASSHQQLWQLTNDPDAPDDDRASHQLLFDAKNVSGCSGDGSECSFANIALAAGANVPILDLSFTEDLGGANADNSNEAHLLLDFRASPPQVMVAADCDYNEGGGVCTAIDSGEMDRSNLQCDWVDDKNDFLCTETMNDSPAHRDYFVSTEAKPPLRDTEVATLSDALPKLRAGGPNAKISVAEIGKVKLVAEVQVGSTRKVVVLGANTGKGSSADFFFLTESAGRITQPVSIQTHHFVDKPLGRTDSSKKRDWVVDSDPVFFSKQIYSDASLTVVQVVSGSEPFARTVYWIGVKKAVGLLVSDVIRVAGGVGEYTGCGDNKNSASVVQVQSLRKPFRALVQIQPPYEDSAGGEELSWDRVGNEEPPPDCLRNGDIRWTVHGFQGSMQPAKCHAADKPRFVKIDDAGHVTLTDQLTP